MASNAHPTTFFTGNAQPLRDAQCDYSYDEWRHAQMRQLEGDYLIACERGQHRMSGSAQRAD